MLALPDLDPAKALAPVRRLVLFAFVATVVAGVILVLSTLHVMWSTDDLSQQQERVRAVEVAELLALEEADTIDETVNRLARVSGLRELAVTATPTTEPYRQSIPMFSGPASGQFLTWSADRPGLYLFTTFAPLRVPLMLTMIMSVLGCLMIMQRRVRRIEAERLSAQIEALRDHLTGLPNRRALEAELERLARSRRSFAMLALDLDGFKPVNDIYGHHAGDMALIEVGRRLAAQLRPGEFLARIGGDEFVAIIHRGPERPILTAFARDCITAVSRPVLVANQTVTIGISLGIVAEGLDHPASALLKQADRALYEAKRLDGGAFCFAGDSRTGREAEEWGGAQPLLAKA